MAEELIQIVDANDQPVRGATKEAAWRDGLIHRIVHVYAFGPDGRLLLQKRADNIELYPGRWCESASGHVDEGEDWEQAARREMQEEVGITPAVLEFLGTRRTSKVFQGRKLERFSRSYRTTIEEIPINLQQKEVSSVHWVSLDKVKLEVRQEPEKFTDGLVEGINTYF